MIIDYLAQKEPPKRAKSRSWQPDTTRTKMPSEKKEKEICLGQSAKDTHRVRLLFEHCFLLVLPYHYN